MSKVLAEKNKILEKNRVLAEKDKILEWRAKEAQKGRGTEVPSRTPTQPKLKLSSAADAPIQETLGVSRPGASARGGGAPKSNGFHYQEHANASFCYPPGLSKKMDCASYNQTASGPPREPARRRGAAAPQMLADGIELSTIARSKLEQRTV